MTDVYQARGGFWYKVRDPLPGRKLSVQQAVRSRTDYSNAFSETGEFVAYKPKRTDICDTLRLPEAEGRAESIDDCHDWVILGSDRACEAPSIVILDRPDGRYVGKSKLLLNVPAGAKVRIAGHDSGSNGCAPVYMWITAQ